MSEALSFLGATDILSCAPNILSCVPKILAVHLEIYTWRHKSSQSQK